jgi:hypothetical protein
MLYIKVNIYTSCCLFYQNTVSTASDISIIQPELKRFSRRGGYGYGGMGRVLNVEVEELMRRD